MKRCTEETTVPRKVKKTEWEQFKDREYRELLILGTRAKFQIDSGADLSIMSLELVEHLGIEEMVRESGLELAGPSGEPLEVKGTVDLTVKYEREEHRLMFVIVRNGSELLSGRDASVMGILEFDKPNMSKVNNNGMIYIINTIVWSIKKEAPSKYKTLTKSPSLSKSMEEGRSVGQRPASKMVKNKKPLLIDDRDEEDPHTVTVNQVEQTWFSTRFTNEMISSVKSTRITDEEYRLTLREGSRPFISYERPIAFALHSLVGEKIRDLVSTWTLIPCEEADWVSPIVVVKKSNGDLRVWVISGN